MPVVNMVAGDESEIRQGVLLLRKNGFGVEALTTSLAPRSIAKLSLELTIFNTNPIESFRIKTAFENAWMEKLPPA